jgi:acyl transferase domain-containing protein
MQPIAVIGLSCLFPEANTPEDYWKNLLQEKDSCTPATASNMEADPSRFFEEKKGTPDKYYCARGGYIRGFCMNPDGFLLPAETIEKLGATFQWSLHVARESLRDSGYFEEFEILKKCGIVLGNLSFPTNKSNHLILPLYQKILEPLLQNALNRPDFSLGSFAAERGNTQENPEICEFSWVFPLSAANDPKLKSGRFSAFCRSGSRIFWYKGRIK